MTPEEAVTCLAAIVGARDHFTQDEIYSALAHAGVPDALADRAYKFMQIAWGQVFLAGLGVQFSQDYQCLDARGTVVESGKLHDEECFATAMRLSETYSRYRGFSTLAVMSADVAAVNEMLKAGSKPENLVMAPSLVFLEPPTEAGLASADRLSAALLEGQRSSNSSTGADARQSRKPWWRFWS